MNELLAAVAVVALAAVGSVAVALALIYLLVRNWR